MDYIEQLYRRYFNDVYLYLKVLSRNEDIAEELTQETFFKAIKGAGRDSKTFVRGDGKTLSERVLLKSISRIVFPKDRRGI